MPGGVAGAQSIMIAPYADQEVLKALSYRSSFKYGVSLNDQIPLLLLVD
jgi:hypothetical protein